MTETTGQQDLLADKVVWIIDDEVAENLGDLPGFEANDYLQKGYPVDRGTLLALLNSPNWDDGPVKDICRILVKSAKNVLAFTQPVAAIEYLVEGELVPDLILYDLKYTSLPNSENSLSYLESLLNCGISVVQVYAQDVETVSSDLGKLRAKYSTRLQEPRNKGEVDGEHLANILGEKNKKQSVRSIRLENSSFSFQCR
jgi:hypothetical protein